MYQIVNHLYVICNSVFITTTVSIRWEHIDNGKFIVERAQTHLQHDRRQFSNTCKRCCAHQLQAIHVVKSFLILCQVNGKVEKKTDEFIVHFPFPRIVFDCQCMYAGRRTKEIKKKKSLNRITYEKFDNNGDHFEWFTFQDSFFFLLSSSFTSSFVSRYSSFHSFFFLPEKSAFHRSAFHFILCNSCRSVKLVAMMCQCARY